MTVGCAACGHPVGRPIPPPFRYTREPPNRACAWIDLLAESGIGLWQILPLNPVDAVGSPYASPSSAAIDPRLHHALASDVQVTDIETMRALEEQPWLDLHATFYALRDMHGTPWASWPHAIRSSTPRSEDIDADRRRHHARCKSNSKGHGGRSTRMRDREA